MFPASQALARSIRRSDEGAWSYDESIVEATHRLNGGAERTPQQVRDAMLADSIIKALSTMSPEVRDVVRRGLDAL